MINSEIEVYIAYVGMKVITDIFFLRENPIGFFAERHKITRSFTSLQTKNEFH